MQTNERMYRYSCKVNGEYITGVTFNTCKQNVIDDVRGNFGAEAKRIIVVWLKKGTTEYELAILEK